MKKIFLITTLLLFFQASFACSCSFFWASEAIIKDLSQNSDLVVIGHPIKNIDDNFISANPKYMGTMILFKVDSIIKGELKSDTIFINQETIGNCSQYFMPNEKYVIFGNQIKHYKTIAKNDHFTFANYCKKNKTVTLYNNNKNLQVYKNLTEKYYTISTDQCISFTSQSSSVWEYFNLKE